MSESEDYRQADIRRLLAVGVLLVINGLLIVGILDKQSVGPFGEGDGGEAAFEADEFEGGDEDGTDGGQGLTTDSANPDALTTDSTIPGQTGIPADDFDDWPGGRGPIPAGPPIPRRMTFDDSGLLLLSGSVPSWAVATDIVDLAGTRLPGGIGLVDNQLTWHPDASEDLQSGSVAFDPAVLYPTGSTAIPPESLPGLDVVNGILVSNPTVFAVIIGHTDDLGDTEENAAVAFARATGVVEYLQSQGSNPAQLVIAAAGAGQPAASNETEEGQIINRRIEIQFKNFLSPEAVGG